MPCRPDLRSETGDSGTRSDDGGVDLDESVEVREELLKKQRTYGDALSFADRGIPFLGGPPHQAIVTIRDRGHYV